MKRRSLSDGSRGARAARSLVGALVALVVGATPALGPRHDRRQHRRRGQRPAGHRHGVGPVRRARLRGHLRRRPDRRRRTRGPGSRRRSDDRRHGPRARPAHRRRRGRRRSSVPACHRSATIGGRRRRRRRSWCSCSPPVPTTATSATSSSSGASTHHRPRWCCRTPTVSSPATRRRRTVDFSLGTWSSATSFFDLGIEHIRFGPDHLLFLLVLTLAVAGTTVTRATTWRTVKLVTAFTVGHAVSLCLAYFDLISVPAGLVEPAISLSIVAAAVLAIRGRAERRPTVDRRRHRSRPRARLRVEPRQPRRRHARSGRRRSPRSTSASTSPRPPSCCSSSAALWVASKALDQPHGLGHGPDRGRSPA